MSIFFIFIAFIVEIFFSSGVWANESWPKVRSDENSIVILEPGNPEKAGLEEFLYSTDGKPLYELKCHNSDFETVDVNYSGLMQCYLFSTYSSDSVKNLFDDTMMPGKSWENRGRFLVNHLREGCAQYPEWGATRHFVLRGMKLTITISNVLFLQGTENSKGPVIRSYKFSVKVIPYRKALSDHSVRPNEPEPQWFYYDVACSDKR